MEIYFEILTYILSEKICLERIGTYRCRISDFMSALTGEKISADSLYVIDFAKLEDKEFNIPDVPFPVNYIFTVKNGDEGSDDLRKMLSMLKPLDNYAVISYSENFTDILKMLEGAFYEFIQWDAGFDKMLLKNDDIKKVLDAGQRYLPWPYYIFDKKINAVYFNDGMPQTKARMNLPVGHDFFDSMIQDKKFHELIKEKDVFYYDSVETEVTFGRNLTVNGEYIACLVMLLDYGQRKIHPGAEEIFRIFAAHIQDSVTYGRFVLENRSNDTLHLILRNLADGKEISEDVITMNLNNYVQTSGCNMQVVVFKFFAAEGWPSQHEATLPYLALWLEKDFAGCVSVAVDNEILMLHFSDTDKEKTNKKFFQKIAEFVRENICVAGISSTFQDSHEISSAINCARAALDTGRRIKPHLWYYLFDDYRLEYMTELLKKGLSDKFICHPIFNILEKYDNEHGSELNRTLYVYLKNNLNMTAAANEIFINRTSFFYRLNHIKELTGIDLDDPDTVLSLMISYKIRGTDKWDKAAGQKT